jgi:hypothetical protein
MTKRFRRFIQAWGLLATFWCAHYAFVLGTAGPKADLRAWWWFRPLVTEQQLGYLWHPLNDFLEFVGINRPSPAAITFWLGLYLLAAQTVLLCFLLIMHFTVRVKQPGVCDACGYDLRATPERCPECGKLA